MIAFSYYGAKHTHLNDILPLLPETESYCEPFMGSLAVMLNRPPALIEVANDLNQDLVNFFMVLQGKRGWELVERVALTPYSRAIFARACKSLEGVEDFERAFLWYVRISQSRNNLPNAKPGNWSFATQFPRREMAGPVSKWLNKPSRLAEVIDRLMRIQFECDDAIKVIERYDSDKCLFYVDPPYVTSTRKHAKVYAYEMDDTGHRVLSETLHACKGRVALSGYDGSLYDILYGDWYKTVFEEKMVGSSSKTRSAAEVLWTNYDPAKLEEERTGVKQLDMFGELS